MSKRTVVLASCNLCPDGAHDVDARELSYITLSIEGQTYGLDLCDNHFLDVKGSLQDYISKADIVGGGARSSGASSGPRVPGSTTSATSEGLDPATVRAWARSAGLDVPEVGRINLDIINAYKAAQGSSPAPTPAPVATQVAPAPEPVSVSG